MVALRRALEEHGGHGLIANVSGRGYVFTGQVLTVEEPAVAEPERTRAQATGLFSSARLPGGMTSLVGRRDDVNALIRDTLSRRMVTVVGAGGIGKTSTAVAAARIIAGEVRDGAVFVDLSALSSGDLVAPALASAVGVSVVSGDPLANAIALLQDKNAILLLDNCDRFIDATVDVVRRVLEGTRSMLVLATSREPLRIDAEWVHRLPPLEAPPEGLDATLESVMRYPSVQLFVERAMATDGAFKLSDDEAPAVAQLCRRLDGLPLAIELAAARTAVLSVKELVSRLDDRLRLLKSDRRTPVPRHRTLEATLDWSFQLLTPAEQRMLTRLALFRERFSLEWALAVAAEDAADGIEELSSLAAKSLISVDVTDAFTPYRLLESTRCFALARLAASGDRASISRRHALHVCALLCKAVDEIEGLGHGAWREKHARAIDDVRCALEWCLGPEGDIVLGARIAALSATLWISTSMLSEYLAQLEKLVAQSPSAGDDPAVAAQVWAAIGFCRSTLRGPRPEAYEALQRALASAEQSKQLRLQLPIHWTKFTADILQGEYAAVLADSLAFGEVAKAISDQQAELIFHRMMALSRYFMGCHQEALRHAELAVGPGSNAIGMTAGAPSQLDHRVAALTMMARILWMLGQTVRALEVGEQARMRAVEAGHVTSLIYTLSFASCPLALWSRKRELAERAIDALRDCCVRHGIPFFGSWFTVFDHALHLGEAAPLSPAPFPATGFTPAHAEMMVTLDPTTVTDDLVRRAQSGLCPWCAPEVYRAQALTLVRAIQVDTAEALLDEGIALAIAQGAVAWQARLAATRLEVLEPLGRAPQAQAQLEQVIRPLSAADREILLAAR